jgi:hypothetical protein
LGEVEKPGGKVTRDKVKKANRQKDGKYGRFGKRNRFWFECMKGSAAAALLTSMK